MLTLKIHLRHFISKVIQRIAPSVYRNNTFKKFKLAFEENKVDQEFSILPYLLTNTSYVLDIGANNGEYCYFFQEVIKTTNIIAFEPIPRLYKRLQSLFPAIKVFPVAISNSSGNSILHIPYIKHQKFETRAKLDLIHEQNETKLETIKVQKKTIDELFFHSSTKIDFIKIDIEGHELQAIRGAKKVIEKDYPILFVEIEKRHHPTDFNEVFQEICNLGYACFFMDKNELHGFSEFSIVKHQDLALKENYYIHNFFFFPLNFSVDELNKNIKSTL